MSHRTPHRWLLKLNPDVKRRFDSLPRSNKRAVFRKLRDLLEADAPYTLPFVEMLKARKFQRVRKFRAGDYRVFFVIESVEVQHQEHTYQGSLFMLDIRDRKDAY